MSLEIIKLKSKYDSKTENVKNFYTSNPFPNYKEDDNKASILKKGNKSLLSKTIKNLFRNKKKILEIGSGTCQLSAYFAIDTNNEVYAFDATFKSLEIGKNFAEKNNIKNIKFLNGNILDNNIKKEYFDLVWCNGVLHHTTDPYLGFKNSLSYLKKNGLILVGVYNYYGRLITKLMRILYQIFGKKIILYLDPIAKDIKKSKNEKNAWIEDQFNHPLEKTYTFKEIYEWFIRNDVSLISTIPNSTKIDFDKINNKIILEAKNQNLNKFQFLREIMMNFNSFGKDGGLFVFIGIKK